MRPAANEKRARVAIWQLPNTEIASVSYHLWTIKYFLFILIHFHAVLFLLCRLSMVRIDQSSISVVNIRMKWFVFCFRIFSIYAVSTQTNKQKKRVTKHSICYNCSKKYCSFSGCFYCFVCVVLARFALMREPYKVKVKLIVIFCLFFAYAFLGNYIISCSITSNMID